MNFYLKSILFLVFLLNICGAHVRNKRSLDERLRKFLDTKARDILQKGNVSLGIPVMDPYVADQQTFNLNYGKISVNADMRDFNVKGMSKYIVNNAAFSLLSMTMNFYLKFGEITSEGHYNINGHAFDQLNIFGEGLYNLTVKDFEVNCQVVLSLRGGVSIKSIDLKIVLNDFKLMATGIFNDDKLSVIISEIISDMAPAIVKDFHDEITDIASDKIIQMGNDMLAKLTWQDLIGMIG